MPNPICWYRARRHAKAEREWEAFRANLGCSDETLRQMAEDVGAVWATLPSAADWTAAMRQLSGALKESDR